MNEAEYRKLASEMGYGEPLFQQVDAGPEEEMHKHEHSVFSLVLSGVFSMTTEQGTKIFREGDICENLAGTMHRERTGPEGGSFLFAKK